MIASASEISLFFQRLSIVLEFASFWLAAPEIITELRRDNGAWLATAVVYVEVAVRTSALILTVLVIFAGGFSVLFRFLNNAQIGFIALLIGGSLSITSLVTIYLVYQKIRDGKFKTITDVFTEIIKGIVPSFVLVLGMVALYTVSGPQLPPTPELIETVMLTYFVTGFGFVIAYAIMFISEELVKIAIWRLHESRSTRRKVLVAGASCFVLSKFLAIIATL